VASLGLAFIDQLGLQLDMMKAWIPRTTHGADLNIMDYFLSRNHPPSDLMSINQCRIYLQLIFLSNMVSADGSQLVVDALHGKKLIDRRSTLEWPEQQNPSRADWNIWSQAFQHLVRGKFLLNPIILTGQSPHMEWSWYMDRNWTEDSFHLVEGRL
jgi:hypothetical protein